MKDRIIKALIVVSIWLCSIMSTHNESFGELDSSQRQIDEKGKNKENPPLVYEYISMNFNDVDIRVVIKFISELTGKNFIIDDKVKGKVMIISSSKISIQDAYNVFESMLEVKGYTTIPSGMFIKIVPAAEARYRDVATKVGRDVGEILKEDKIVTQVVPLKYARAKELSNILRPLLPKESKIVVYPTTNTLILTDYSSNIQRLMTIIDEIDVQISVEKILVVPLVHASAHTVAAKLTELMQQNPMPSISKVIPDKRTNSLIILVKVQKARKIKKLVEKWDHPAEK